MADLPDIQDKGKTLRNKYVPFEKRESQNIDWKPFAIETIKFFVVAKLSALAGFIAGTELNKRGVKLGKYPITGANAAYVAGFLGGVFKMFSHWKKSEGKRVSVKNVSGDLHEALSPELVEKETKKEAEILDDLKLLQEKLAERKVNHAETQATRRENAPSEMGLSA